MEINKGHDFSSNREMHKLLGTCTTTKEDLSEILHNLQDSNHPKLTIGMFFEFMKTAYQVNESFENLAETLTASSEVDWNSLAKINLNFETDNNSDSRKDINNSCVDSITCQEKNANAICVALQNHDTISTSIKENLLCSIVSTSSKYCNDYKQVECVAAFDESKDSGNKDSLLNEKEMRLENQLPNNSSLIEETKVLQSGDPKENLLTAMLKTNLSDVLHEGLLDSVLPYMIPKPVVSEPIIKKSITNTDIKKTSSLNFVETKVLPSSNYKEKDRDKTCKRSLENEVEIHVCDEEKNIKKNFRCPQKLLIQKMCYFADVTAGQKLEEIDISVHCDVIIFDWLMRWVKKDIIKKSEWPVLEPSNVIPIMVSASFLQMEPLLENCLQYCHDNMSDILKTSTILTCLDDNLLSKLADRFTNEDVETLKDKRDKIQSKLFCKLITSLAEVTPDSKKGHYSSLATLFKCSKCRKHIIQSISTYVPCIAHAMKIDNRGTVHNKHVRDLTWTLNDYIVGLRMELRSWHKVYWRLWGDCHFLFCTQCNIYFPIHQMGWCCYHPELPQFFINEQQRPMPFPLGRYPCCSQRAYRFEALPNREGCRYREHIPDIKTQTDINILNIFTVHREVIAMEPPQLYFPEKVTRLVARDPSIQPGKLICKDTMWWTGVELVPQRPRLGLLGKIWSGAGFRRFFQIQDSQKPLQKMCRQASNTTDTSSPTSSITDSDEDDCITGYEDSSVDEESYYSEESNVWPIFQTTSKTKKKSKNQVTRRSNGRCWSDNLNIRHNQDNQRDFEERAAVQMTALLTKRVSMDPSSLLKSSNKQGWKKYRPAGGTYVKLEAEFREQFNQSFKCKNSTTKSFVRLKPNKTNM